MHTYTHTHTCTRSHAHGHKDSMQTRHRHIPNHERMHVVSDGVVDGARCTLYSSLALLYSTILPANHRFSVTPTFHSMSGESQSYYQMMEVHTEHSYSSSHPSISFAWYRLLYSKLIRRIWRLHNNLLATCHLLRT